VVKGTDERVQDPSASRACLGEEDLGSVKRSSGTGYRVPGTTDATPRTVISAVLLALILLAQGLISAPAEGATLTDTPVLERMEVNFSSFTRATLNATVAIHEYFNGSIDIPADVLRAQLNSPGQEAFRSSLEDYASRLFCGTAVRLAPGGGFTLGSTILDESSLVDEPGSDEYHPPVVLKTSGELILGPADFGLQASADVDRLAPLLLSDGAWLQRILTLTAGPGCSLVVQLDCFPGAIFAGSGSGRQVLLADNSLGSWELVKYFNLTILSQSASPGLDDSARISGIIDIPDLVNVVIRGTMEMERADPREYWNIPAEIRNITTVSGMTLSELARSGLLSIEDIYERGIRPMIADFQNRLASLFSVNISFSPSWSTAGNLSCTVSASSSGEALFSLDSDLVRGALNAGAQYQFSFPVELGWPTSLELLPPAGMVLKGLAPASNASGGRTPYLYNNTGTGILKASLASAHPASLSDDVRIEVMTDFNRPSPQLGRLLWDQDTDVPVVVDARVMMGSFAVPGDIASLLPANLSLHYISADLVRLLLDKGVIGDAEMSSLLSELRPRVESAMRAALGSGVHPTVKFVPASLQGYHIDRMDGARPVVIEAWASGMKEKHFDMFKMVRASPGILRISQDFALKGVAGASVTYRMRFAPELKLASADGHGARVARGSDGSRDFFEVSFGTDGGAANVTAYLEPAPGFLLLALGPQLSPCVALFIAIAAVIFIKIRKRHKRRKARLILRKPD
jgi:hypothetical protein